MSLLLPISITALTGVAYRFCRGALQLPKENVLWLLEIHQGAYYSFDLRYSSYIAVIYCTLLWAAIWSAAVLGLLLNTYFQDKIIQPIFYKRHPPHAPHV